MNFTLPLTKITLKRMDFGTRICLLLLLICLSCEQVKGRHLSPHQDNKDDNDEIFKDLMAMDEETDDEKLDQVKMEDNEQMVEESTSNDPKPWAKPQPSCSGRCYYYNKCLVKNVIPCHYPAGCQCFGFVPSTIEKDEKLDQDRMKDDKLMMEDVISDPKPLWFQSSATCSDRCASYNLCLVRKFPCRYPEGCVCQLW